MAQKLALALVALFALVAAAFAEPSKLLDRDSYPKCSEEDANAYPAVLDAFSGTFSWGWSSVTKGTCWYEGPPRELVGPADKTIPRCSEEDAKAYPLTPDASGRFDWGWNGSRSCWYAPEKPEPKEDDKAAPEPSKDEDKPEPKKDDTPEPKKDDKPEPKEEPSKKDDKAAPAAADDKGAIPDKDFFWPSKDGKKN